LAALPHAAIGTGYPAPHIGDQGGKHPAIIIEHEFDHLGLLKPSGDLPAERRAEQARRARRRLGTGSE